MKKLGLIALLTIGCAAVACAQALETLAEPVAAAAPLESAPAPAVISVQGAVSVVNGPDGALQAIYINPAEGHGYKVDILNGEGKTLADKDGQTVQATGIDADRLFNIQSVSVAE